MNKIIKFVLVIVALCLCGFANAQYQITNGDFETWSYDGDNLPNNWNSFQTADGTWASSGYDKSNRQVKKATDIRPGSSGSYSCAIWARSITILWSTVIAQGNITTGRVHAGSTSADNIDNYNYSDRDGSNGTNPCAMKFSGHPDAISVWVKFAPAGTVSGYENAKFSCVVHDDHDYISYGLSSNDNDTNKGYVVASVAQEFPKCDWKNYILDFTYNESNNDSKYIQFNASTNAYPGKGTKNDYLYIDDIVLIYNSELTSASYNGIALSSDGTTLFSGSYDESKLALVSNGHAATIDKSYDSSSNLLTVTVKGENISEDATNLHTYTYGIKFCSSELSSAKYNGASLTFSNDKAYVSGSYNESSLALVSKDSGATIEKSYNSSTDELTVTVMGENFSSDAKNYHTYTIKFYPSELTSARYDGSSIRLTVSQPTCTQVYDESKELELELSSASATAEKSYDPETGMLTITVKGGNYSTDPSNYNEYTIRFYNVAATMAVKEGVTYGTFAAPIAVTIPSGVTAYKATDVNNIGTITLEAITGTLAKNTAVIVESTSAVSKEFTGNADMSATKSCTTGLLTGVYTATSAPAGSYVLQNKDNIVGFYKVGSTAPTVGAFRAYIDASKVSNVKAIYFDEATAIKAINALTSGEPTEIYSVSGARQDKLQKGMNIVKMTDGSTQKILVK